MYSFLNVARRCAKVPSTIIIGINIFDYDVASCDLSKTNLMSKAINLIELTEEVIINKIYFLRGKKVMIDRDLAELYGVETKVLKQAVRRNITRFPSDFLFEMDKSELENWRSQNVTSREDGYLPG